MRFVFGALLLGVMLVHLSPAQEPPAPLEPPEAPPVADGVVESFGSIQALFRITAEPESGLSDVGARHANGFLQLAVPRGVSVFVPPPNNDSRPGAAVVLVTLASHDKQIGAEQLKQEMEKLRAGLEKKLRELDTTQRTQQKQVAEERARLAMIAAQILDQEEALRKHSATYQMDNDPQLAAEKRSRLGAEMQGLGVEMSGLEARRKVIQAQISKLSEKVENKGSRESVLEHLMKAVEARKAIVVARREAHATGQTTPEPLQEAIDSLAQAEAELAKYRADLADAAGGNRIAELKQRLEDTEIQSAETQAKFRAAFEASLEMGARSSEWELRWVQLDALKNEYRRRATELNELSGKLEQYQPPAVTFVLLGK